MLSTPRSLGFILAVVLGAMLVPGCRPNLSGPAQAAEASSSDLTASQITPD
jgi:hypothetical protein